MGLWSGRNITSGGGFSRTGFGGGGGDYDANFWKIAIGIVIGLLAIVFAVYDGCGVSVDRECHNGTRLYTPGTFKEKWCIKEKDICYDYDDDGFSHSYTCWRSVKCFKGETAAVKACKTGRYR